MIADARSELTQRPIADLAELAVRLGDDALVASQRLCGWITRAPTIEEDLAMSNIALDLLGHARYLLDLAGRQDGSGRDADDFAYGRTEREFRHVALVEEPDVDFADAVVGVLFHSQWTQLCYAELSAGSDPDLAGFAARAGAEVSHHRVHEAQWLRRLGRGTDESRRRATAALERRWRLMDELFADDDLSSRLATAGVLRQPSTLREPWLAAITAVLDGAGLAVPNVPAWPGAGRRGLHGEQFGPMLAELQSVFRQYPGGQW